MDETDVILSQLLLVNSRISYRELADKLGLSANAVHKRIQTLMESGIIRVFTAKVSLYALKAIHIIIFGRSEANSPDDARLKLEKNDSIYWIAVAGGNYLHIGAYLRDISQLEPFVSMVKKEAQMPNLTVGIEQNITSSQMEQSTSDTTIYPLDYQIIYALHKNSRRLLSEIAEELRVSAKTVRRRLSRMMRQGLIELSLEWYPDVSNDIMTIFHINLKDSADKSKDGPFLIRKYSPNMLFFWPFSNLPNHLMCFVWTTSMKQLRDIRESLQKEDFIESINPNILYTGYIYDTWRDKLVQEKGALQHKIS
jgi:DNA-binding Lrp family transcriptional regulator